MVDVNSRKQKLTDCVNFLMFRIAQIFITFLLFCVRGVGVGVGVGV